PMLLARSAEWWYAPNPEGAAAELRAGIDIYNATDRQPENNRMNWAALPPAWSALEQAIDVPKLGTFRVDHSNLGARVKLNDITAASRQPLGITFVDGFTGKSHHLSMVAPVAWCEKRQCRIRNCDWRRPTRRFIRAGARRRFIWGFAWTGSISRRRFRGGILWSTNCGGRGARTFASCFSRRFMRITRWGRCCMWRSSRRARWMWRGG